MVEERKQHPLTSYESIKAIMSALTCVADDIRWMGAGGSLYTNLANGALRGYIASELIHASENEGVIIKKYNVAKSLICATLKKSTGEVKKDVKKESCKEIDVDKPLFDQIIPYTEYRIEAGVEAANELFFRNSEEEERLVEVATVIARYVELIELKHKVPIEYYSSKERECKNSLDAYKEASIPGVDYCTSRTALERYVEISKSLREQPRWKLQASPNKISILEHSYVTGVLAFFNCLELTGNEEEAGKCFFMGIDHDLSETWTADTPSSLKDKPLEEIIKSYFYKYSSNAEIDVDGIFEEIKTLTKMEQRAQLEEFAIKNFGTVPKDLRKVLNLFEAGKNIRTGIEIVEDKFLEENFYKKLPDYMVSKTKELMYEEPENKDYFPTIKAADYIGAAWECWYECLYGSNDSYFVGPIRRTIPDVESGKYKTGPNIRKLLDFYKEETETFINSSTISREVEKLKKENEELRKESKDMKKEIAELKEALKQLEK